MYTHISLPPTVFLQIPKSHPHLPPNPSPTYRSGHLPKILARYGNGNLSKLDLTLCPRISDGIPSRVAAENCAPELRSIDLSQSGGFSACGLASLFARCVNLVEFDFLNAAWLRDSAMAVVAEARNLEKLIVA